jgi:hypothetical protein
MGTLVSTVYVKILDLGIDHVVENVIYLSKPPEAEKEQIVEFNNPFEARQFIREQRVAQIQIKVAA